MISHNNFEKWGALEYLLEKWKKLPLHVFNSEFALHTKSIMKIVTNFSVDAK